MTSFAKKIYFLQFTLSVCLFSANTFSADIFYPERCKDRIEQITCAVDYKYVPNPELSLYDNQRAEMSLRCLPESSTYAAQIMKEFDKLPPVAQEAFCYIEKVFFPAHGFEATGAANVLVQPLDHPTPDSIYEVDGEWFESMQLKGFVLHLNPSRFKVLKTYDEAQTRLLQRTFGVDVLKDGFDQELPIFRRQATDSPSAILGTIMHEVGHLVDFTGGFTQNSFCEEKYSEFFSLSWEFDLQNTDESVACSSHNPKFREPFQHLQGWTKSYLKDDLRMILQELQNSSFASMYAMANPWEDFAEQFTAHYLGMGSVLHIGEGVLLNFEEKTHPKFLEKKRIIESIGPEIFQRVNQVTYRIPLAPTETR